MILHALVAVLLCLTVTPAASTQVAPPPAPAIDVDDLLAETQRNVRGKEYVGLVWWVPVEYWLASSDSAKAEDFDALRPYTVVVAVVGKVSGLGAIQYVPSSELRANLRLRDAEGQEYEPLGKISQEAQLLADIMKPMFKNALGPAGEHMDVFFFPTTGKNGKPIADPYGHTSFAVVLKKVAGQEESAYEWQLPLTSLSPPKFCPAGKERVQANWKYCPWHGVRLDQSERPATKK